VNSALLRESNITELFSYLDFSHLLLVAGSLSSFIRKNGHPNLRIEGANNESLITNN